ncbi:MAG TPA: hypothetical protein VIY49_08930 [Bryobacteraceae bacterium]
MFRLLWIALATAQLWGADPRLGTRKLVSAQSVLIGTTIRCVESTYKRGDQVVEKDRWVVSADGLQMTVTTTGMPVDGESLKEDLTYRKQ